MLKKLNSTVILIVLTALIFRLIGITYGFPFIFHPDEPSVIRSALGLRFNLNPEHFDWPHLYFYLNYFIYMVFGKIRTAIEVLRGVVPILWDDNVIFYLLSRILSAVLGALTVIPVYLTGKNLFNNKVGLVSALIFALLPFHIKHSHYALIDVPMVFLLSCSLYFATQIYLWRNYKDYFLSGIFAGLAASTKYNGGLIIICILLAHLIRYIQSKDNLFSIKSLKQLSWAGFASILGFLIGTPFALLDYTTFLITDGPRGALWQFANVGKVSFVMQVTQFFDAILFKISDDLGYTFIVLYGIGIYFAFSKNYKNHLSRLLLLIVPSLLFLFYISGFEKNRSHYYMITYPFIAIVAAFALIQLYTILKKKNKYLVYVLFFVSFLIPLVLVSVDNYSLSRPDTRVLLYRWLKDNIESTDYLVYGSNEIQQVTDKFINNPKSKLTPDTLYTRPGYLLVSPDVSDQQIILTNLDYNYLSEEISFSPEFRKGPPITVYSFGQND